jgi:2-oxoacid:acceptor oxidoreductase delta subunit (pyruvate/2-ketoisovalerate family)
MPKEEQNGSDRIGGRSRVSQALLIAILVLNAYFFATVVANVVYFRRATRRPTMLGGPFVSVIVPARNEEDRIADCIESLLDQDYADYELLVVDDDSTDQTRAIVTGSNWTIAVALGVGILVAVVLSGAITRSITRPVNRAIASLEAGSDQVTSAAGEIASSSQQLAEGTSQQAASIEETSSALEEMSSMTRQNADNAGEANRLMTEAGAVVTEAGSARNYVTGEWRSGQRPDLDTKRCTSCMLCWVYCPDSAIKVENGKVVGIDYDHCKGCGICANECPTNPKFGRKSIEMVPEGCELPSAVAAKTDSEVK